MKAAVIIAICILAFVAIDALPVNVYHSIDDPNLDVVVVGTPTPPELMEPSEEEDDDWRAVEGFAEGSMGKRSIALGRSGFRPGKRSMDNFNTIDVRDLIMKRSMAIGRLGLRPGKRSMAYGRQGFRPGKRSMAYGRQGFRPGKRSVEVPDIYPIQTPDYYVF